MHGNVVKLLSRLGFNHNLFPSSVNIAGAKCCMNESCQISSLLHLAATIRVASIRGGCKILQVCHGCHGIKWYPMHLARTVATHAPLEVMFTTFTGFLVAIWFTISKYITAALRLWLCTLQIVLEGGDQASPSMSPDSCGVTGNGSGTSFVNLLNTRIPNSLKNTKAYQNISKRCWNKPGPRHPVALQLHTVFNKHGILEKIQGLLRKGRDTQAFSVLRRPSCYSQHATALWQRQIHHLKQFNHSEQQHLNTGVPTEGSAEICRDA